MAMAEKSAQNVGSEPRKRRTQAQKVGRLVYISGLVERILKEIAHLRIGQRYIIEGLSIGGYLVFDKPFIEHVVCCDDVDQAILVELHHAGCGGVLPKDIAHALNVYGLNRFQVLRRIQHMNKLLEEEIAQKVAEKQGHKWALTSFAREAWGSAKEGLI